MRQYAQFIGTVYILQRDNEQVDLNTLLSMQFLEHALKQCRTKHTYYNGPHLLLDQHKIDWISFHLKEIASISTSLWKIQVIS